MRYTAHNGIGAAARRHGFVLRTPRRGAGHVLRSAQRRAGFTLLEVLVAMTILTIIGAAIFTMFRQSTNMYSKTIAHTRQFIAAREALGLMASELRQARLVPVTVGAVIEQHGFWGFKEDAGTPEKDVSVFFVAPTGMRNRATSKQDLCVIGYWLEDPNGDGQYDLMRYCLTDADADWRLLACPGSRAELEDHSEKLGLLVRDLRYEYWDDTATTWDTADEEWTTPDYLPRAVRITLVVIDPSEPAEVKKDKTFTTVVNLDNAL